MRRARPPIPPLLPRARLSGDDIYNADGATITFGPTGKGWALDGEPDCYDFITGWYDDSETTRWNAHGDDESARHTVLFQPGTELTDPLSLKAAHGSTGSLTVCKETVGELLPSDYDTVFTFELTLDDDTEEPQEEINLLPEEDPKPQRGGGASYSANAYRDINRPCKSCGRRRTMRFEQ